MMMGNYETQTTFWTDFTIADRFGLDAVRDTYDRAFAGWKTHAAYLTELVMVLNWKIWQHHEQKHTELAKLYDELYWTAAEYAETHLKGEELSYYYRTTD